MTSQTLHRTGFAAALGRLLATIDLGFCKLNRIQFSAPWRTERRGRC